MAFADDEGESAIAGGCAFAEDGTANTIRVGEGLYRRAGDWCLEGRVESAWSSAMALSRKLLPLL